MRFADLFLTLPTAAIGNIGVLTAEDTTKHETAYGNPDLVVDQGDHWKLNFGSTACPGHYICYVPKDGERHSDESWGNPDDMVDEGDR